MLVRPEEFAHQDQEDGSSGDEGGQRLPALFQVRGSGQRREFPSGNVPAVAGQGLAFAQFVLGCCQQVPALGRDVQLGAEFVAHFKARYERPLMEIFE